jgi:hypothetical protein
MISVNIISYASCHMHPARNAADMSRSLETNLRNVATTLRGDWNSTRLIRIVVRAFPLRRGAWEAPLEAGMTRQAHMPSPSRGALLASEVCCQATLLNRGRRECRELAAPMARLQQEMQAAGTTGSAETSRHSPRDGFTAYFAFSPVLRAFWPPLPARRGKRHSKRDTSVGVSGPRDLTVRIVLFVGMETTLQHRHAHRIPPQRP